MKKCMKLFFLLNIVQAADAEKKIVQLINVLNILLNVNLNPFSSDVIERHDWIFGQWSVVIAEEFDVKARVAAQAESQRRTLVGIISARLYLFKEKHCLV